MNFADMKNSKGQVERLARSYYRKYYAMLGASLTVEDLEQEFWLVWHSAVSKFRPELGYDFKGFLGVAIRNRALDLARMNARSAHVRAASLDQPVTKSDNSLIDFVESDDEPVEHTIIKNQERIRILSSIDPRLVKIIEILENPTPMVREQLEAARAKASFAASQGLSFREPKDLTLTMLVDMMGMSRTIRYRMIDELNRAIENE